MRSSEKSSLTLITITLVLMSAFVFLNCPLSGAEDTKKTLSEIEGLDVLRQTIERDALYPKHPKMKCLHFYTEGETAALFDFAIREKHGAGCPGDPNFEPIVDRFRLMRATKKLLWYDVVDGEYIPYDRRKVARE